MDIIKSIDLDENFKNLGYDIVRQAFIDYRNDLKIIKKYKNKDFVKKMKIEGNVIKRIKERGIYVKKRDDDIALLLKKNIYKKLNNSKRDIKEINEFVDSEWYSKLCPIINNRIAKDKLREMENEILGKEIYLLEN